jgi:hypothetical protein
LRIASCLPKFFWSCLTTQEFHGTISILPHVLLKFS